MSSIQRYAEDFTGTNPDNRVEGELYSLTTSQIRGVVPSYGPFFVESLIVFDKATGRRLEKKETAEGPGDYVVPFISQEISLRTGKSIADSLLITNKDVSDKVLLTYQCVGGNFQNNIDNLVNIYETYLKDERSVDWVTGVFGKPHQYPPSEHVSYLANIFGFEPIVYQLERIAQAINLSNSPALEALYDSIMSNVATKRDIQLALEDSRKFINQARLLDASKTWNFNTLILTPSKTVLEDASNFMVNVQSTNLDDNTKLYWTIEHETTKSSDFVASSGSFDIVSHKGSFEVNLAQNLYVEKVESFRVAIRLNSPTGTIMAKTQRLYINAHSVSLVHILKAVRVSPNFKYPMTPKDVRSLIVFRKSRYASLS